MYPLKGEKEPSQMQYVNRSVKNSQYDSEGKFQVNSYA